MAACPRAHWDREAEIRLFFAYFYVPCLFGLPFSWLIPLLLYALAVVVAPVSLYGKSIVFPLGPKKVLMVSQQLRILRIPYCSSRTKQVAVAERIGIPLSYTPRLIARSMLPSFCPVCVCNLTASGSRGGKAAAECESASTHTKEDASCSRESIIL